MCYTVTGLDEEHNRFTFASLFIYIIQGFKEIIFLTGRFGSKVLV